MTQGYSPETPELSGGFNRRSRAFAWLGGVCAVAIISVLAVACGGGGDKQEPTSEATAARVTPTSAQASGGLLTPVLPTPVGTPLVGPTVASAPQLTSVGSGDRLVIAKFGVNAPLTYKTVASDGTMPNPNGADDVAYYNFAGWPGKGGAPGQGGNSVFAGHVDSGRTACKNGTVPPPCQAVFWDIGKMSIGDEIEVVIGGSSYKYRVTSNQPVHAENGDWDSIVSARAQETITLITCGGDFNPQTREYTHRQVVVAVRV